MSNNRATWGSKLGFLLAAVGSAVGLGNIWAFPYKMGKTGGFSFLIVYLILAATIGYTLISTELGLGRKHKLSTMEAYAATSKKSKWIGALAVISPFLIVMFYFVLGGYCVEYMLINLSELIVGSSFKMSGADSFATILTNPSGAIIITLLFILINVIVVKKGISNGIEKFNKIGMPALAIMIVIIIIRALSLDGASAGLKFMFSPNFNDFKSVGGIIHLLSTAGGQVFFSLSIAMGILITYGSYIPKDNDIKKSTVSIIFFDTLVALLAGLAVIPSAFALGGKGAEMAGPKLLFVTMQDVFNSMGKIGPVFGVLFYLFVIIAALSSSISLCEVLVAYVADRRSIKGKHVNRQKITWITIGVTAIGAVIVAWDGLGSNGLWVPFQSFTVGPFNDCWLDFLDCISEGILMPIGALAMSILFGWIKKPNYILDEIGHSKADTFYKICIKFIVPVLMIIVLLGQISSFFNLQWF